MGNAGEDDLQHSSYHYSFLPLPPPAERGGLPGNLELDNCDGDNYLHYFPMQSDDFQTSFIDDGYSFPTMDMLLFNDHAISPFGIVNPTQTTSMVEDGALYHGDLGYNNPFGREEEHNMMLLSAGYGRSITNHNVEMSNKKSVDEDEEKEENNSNNTCYNKITISYNNNSYTNNDNIVGGEIKKRRRVIRVENGSNKKNKYICSSKMLCREKISEYFDMPITKAAKELNVGLTLLKKRCRELGIGRWPHRKLISLQTLIANVKEFGEEEEDGKVREVVKLLEKQMKEIKDCPDIEMEDTTKKLRQACFKVNYKMKRRKLMIGGGNRMLQQPQMWSPPLSSASGSVFNFVCGAPVGGDCNFEADPEINSMLHCFTSSSSST